MKNDQPLSDAVSLSISEAALYLRSSRNYIYELLYRRQIDWFYRGTRRRILRESLELHERRQAEERGQASDQVCPLCNKGRSASDKRAKDRDH